MNEWDEACIEWDKAWVEFVLAFQELCDSIRLFLREVRVKYWQCQQTSDHSWDYDDPRIAMVSDRNWRTHGKSLCPKCGGILEERAAKVGKH